MAQECSVIMSAMMCHMRSNPKRSQSSPQSVARANRISACPNLGCDCDTVRFFLRCLKASQSHPKGDFFAAFWSSFWKCTSCSWVSRHRAALKIVTPLMRTAVLQRCQSDKFSKNCSRRLYTLFVALLHICYAVFMRPSWTFCWLAMIHSNFKLYHIQYIINRHHNIMVSLFIMWRMLLEPRICMLAAVPWLRFWRCSIVSGPSCCVEKGHIWSYMVISVLVRCSKAFGAHGFHFLPIRVLI